MHKEVVFNDITKVLKGLDIAANAVAGTIGPKGRNVFLDDDYTPKYTNDGAKILARIILKDKLENIGAYTVKNTSGQTNDDVGDGTTTTAVLYQSLVHELLKRPENPIELKESLVKACEVVLKKLAKTGRKITKKDIEKVAFISAENKELAKLITEIVNKLGEKAVINVEDSKTFATDYEIVDGYEASAGFMSPLFINESKLAKAIYTEVPVLVSEKKLSNFAEITPIFEKFQGKGITSCVFVCSDIDDSMLGFLAANKIKGVFNSVVIRATGTLLQDIEGVVGAKAISDKNGLTFANFQLNHLGKAKKIVCDANKTLFMTDGIAAKLYAKTLENSVEGEPNQYLVKQLHQRIAKLKGGVAVLRIGAPTDFGREYLKDKAEDAVKAVQAALEEGVVEGGGMALYRLASQINPKTPGEHVLKNALTSPLRKIIENAGKDYAEIIKNLPEDKGYDAKNDKYVNMFEAGILDPSKVERCALENAVSTASEFITGFCYITNGDEKE